MSLSEYPLVRLLSDLLANSYCCVVASTCTFGWVRTLFAHRITTMPGVRSSAVRVSGSLTPTAVKKQKRDFEQLTQRRTLPQSEKVNRLASTSRLAYTRRLQFTLRLAGLWKLSVGDTQSATFGLYSRISVESHH